jgi:hypothetical protein
MASSTTLEPASVTLPSIDYMITKKNDNVKYYDHKKNEITLYIYELISLYEKIRENIVYLNNLDDTKLSNTDTKTEATAIFDETFGSFKRNSKEESFKFDGKGSLRIELLDKLENIKSKTIFIDDNEYIKYTSEFKLDRSRGIFVGSDDKFLQIANNTSLARNHKFNKIIDYVFNFDLVEKASRYFNSNHFVFMFTEVDLFLTGSLSSSMFSSILKLYRLKSSNDITALNRSQSILDNPKDILPLLNSYIGKDDVIKKTTDDKIRTEYVLRNIIKSVIYLYAIIFTEFKLEDNHQAIIWFSDCVLSVVKHVRSKFAHLLPEFYLSDSEGRVFTNEVLSKKIKELTGVNIYDYKQIIVSIKQKKDIIKKEKDKIKPSSASSLSGGYYENYVNCKSIYSSLKNQL